MNNGGREPNKKDRRYMRTEKAIRAAFLRLAETTEIEKIGVSALAREADIDRKTFYLHYASVEEFINAELEKNTELLIEKLRENVLSSNANEAPDLFKELSAHLAIDMGSMQKIASHLSTEEQIKRMEQPLIDAIVENNIFNFDTTVPNAEYYITFLSAGLLSVYRRWLLSDSNIPLENISEVSHKLIRAVYESAREASRISEHQ